MAVHSIDSEIQLRRWCELVSLLSMDVVRPFYDLMGLRLREPDRLQSVLRQAIVSVRKNMGSDAGPGLVRAVTELLGAEASQQLSWWERHVFHFGPRDNLNLDKWDNILRYCLHDPELWKRLFPYSIWEKALDRFWQSLNIDEFQRRLNELDTRPLSDWDLHLYALRLYDDNLHSSSIPDGPRLLVKPTVREYQGYQFWAWVLSTLRREQLDRLWQAGQRIVEEEELQSARGLPHPSILGIGL